MLEAEPLGALRGQVAPIVEAGAQKLEHADDIGLDKFLGAGDRAVDMGFGGEVHDHVGLKFRDRPRHGGVIADVGAQKGETRIFRDGRERIQIAGVGELIDDENAAAVSLHGHARDRRSDEAAPPVMKSRNLCSFLLATAVSPGQT